VTAPPDDLWSGLDPAVPVVLVPVRLETRFGTRTSTAGDGTAVEVPVLRLRIYPDDVSVVATTAGLDPAERRAGGDFWAAGSTRAAWEVLVRRVGPARAVLVADATRAGAPAVPDRVDQAPTARLLPDAWVVTGYSGDTVVLSQLVPRPGGDPQVGPTRGTGGGAGPAADAFDPDDPHLVTPADGLRWLTEFDAAVAAGMAAVLDLASPEEVRAGALPAVATAGVDTLVVVGVREPTADRSAAVEAALFGDLLTAHAGTDALALLAPGTPTNTVAGRVSGWTTAPDVFAGYDRVLAAAAPGPPAPALPGTPAPATDAAALETALGLEPGLLAGVDGAGGTELAWGSSMARALFPVTLGETIGTLCRPVTGVAAEHGEEFLDRLDTVLLATRDHLADFVRPGGPLPAVRIGHQPYGVLPVMPGTGWVRRDDEPALLGPLADVLGVLRVFWEQAAATVPMVRTAGDPSGDLVRVLGTAPVPHPGAYQVRTATGLLGADFTQLTLLAESPPPVAGTGALLEYLATKTGLAAVVQLQGYRHLLACTLGTLVDATLLERLTLGGTKAMRVAVAATDPSRSGWESPPTYLRRLVESLQGFWLGPPAAGDTRPDDLLFLLAQHALALAGELDTVSLLGRLSGDRARAVLGVAPEVASSGLAVAAVVPQAAATQLGQLGRLDGQVQLPPPAEASTLSAVVADDTLRASVLDALGLPHTHLSGFPGTRAAIGELAGYGLDDATYTRLTGQALAACSTRLDAWITSFATRRLAALRAAGAAGLQIGAWGVLLDVRPGNGTPATAPDGWAQTPGAAVATGPLLAPAVQVGYVHAPSLGQARTAGVLRAGELAHDGDGSSLAAIDLTSARVRVARQVVDAVAAGQPLGAVLGYRLERTLGAAGQHEEVSRLRLAYPQRRVAGGPGDPATGSDSVVPAEVVDGLEVSQHPAAATAAAAPADPGVFAAALEDLPVAVEAVADLLVAEGVHQLTSGRPEHAGATFAAVALGTEPPEIAVVREPRSGVTITHRTVLVPDPAGGAPGWDRTAPRAVLAAAAERWAEGVLGAAADWVLPVGATTVALDTLGVCALDVVVEAAGGAGRSCPLDERLAAAVPAAIVVPAVPGAGPAHGADPADGAAAVAATPVHRRLLALARTAADVLAAARPAVAADLGLPADPAVVSGGTIVHALPVPSAAELAPLVQGLTGVLAGLQAAVDAVTAAAVGQPPETLCDPAPLAPLARLGIPGSVRPAAATVTVEVLLGAASAAAGVLRDCDALVPGAPGGPGGVGGRGAALAVLADGADALGTLTRVARRLGGPAVVPTVEVPSALPDAVVADTTPGAVADWLARMGRVRTALGVYDDLRLFVAAGGGTPEALTVAQLPLVPAEGWLGGPLPAAPGARNALRGWVRPAGPRVHLVLVGPVAAATARQWPAWCSTRWSRCSRRRRSPPASRSTTTPRAPARRSRCCPRCTRAPTGGGPGSCSTGVSRRPSPWPACAASSSTTWPDSGWTSTCR